MVATTLGQVDKSRDAGAIRKDLFLSCLMAAWIFAVWMYLIHRPRAQATLYVGAHTRWLLDIIFPLFIAGTFLIAPILGGCSAIRMVRKRKSRVSIVTGLLLVVFFSAVLFLACAVLWYDRSDLYDVIRQ